jgi:hypothetical protein
MAFALVPFLALFEPSAALPLFGLSCFVIAALGLYRLGERLGLGTFAAWSSWLLALWPTHVLMTGLPENELLVIALLPWVVWAARTAPAQPLSGVLAGMLLGAMVLIQPSFQLLLLLAAGLVWLVGVVSARQVATVLFAVVLGAALVLAPWTLRNLAALGEPVLVSNNGGSNPYRAHNELTTGALVVMGNVGVEALPEQQANREGKRLAVEWISKHPGHFLHLSAGRVLIYPRDDSSGAYAAFRADPDRAPRAAYLALKTGTAVTWLVLWGLIAAAAWQALREQRALPPGKGLLVLLWSCLAGIHTFFASGSKYHLSAIGCVLLLAVLLLRRQALEAGVGT